MVPSTTKALRLGLGAAALAHMGRAMQCPGDMDPYSDEVSPFGWPVTAANFQYATPECWAAKYPMCGGTRQSPVDLDVRMGDAACKPTVGGPDGALAKAFAYKVLAGQPIVTASKYLRAAGISGDLGKITLEGKVWEATHAYLAYGSWHKVNGSSADAELMIVHKAVGHEEDPGPLVVSVLFDTMYRGPSELFEQMGFPTGTERTPAHETPTWKAKESVDIQSVVQAAAGLGAAYSYEGSEPAPPCTANVHYIVFGRPLAVDSTQLSQLADVLTAHAGGVAKRPAIPRTGSGGDEFCREIATNSLVAPKKPASLCNEPNTEHSFDTASCWKQTCHLSPLDEHHDEDSLTSNVHKVSDFFKYHVADKVTVEPSKYSVDAHGDFGGVMIDGRMYKATKVSLKAISQHSENGKHYAGELVIEHRIFGEVDAPHSVGDSHSEHSEGSHSEHSAGSAHHRRLEVETSDDGACNMNTAPIEHKVMLSVPLTLGGESGLLRSIGFGNYANKDALRHGTSYSKTGSFDIGAELAKIGHSSWYSYSGGPTTPGCCSKMGVHWIVIQDPLKVSIEQLNYLSTPVSGMDSTMSAASSETSPTFQRGGLDSPRWQIGGWTGAKEVCASGMRQSPIDIHTHDPVQTGADNFLAKASWKPVSGLRVKNMGDHLRIAGADAQMGYFTLAAGPTGYPKYYQVVDVRLRMPSEHFLDGKQYHAELQITHKNQKTVLELEDDDRVYTSFLFDIGEESKLLKQMMPAHLPRNGSYGTISKPLDLMWALGPAMDGPFYSYLGSETASTCEEVVKWVVFGKPMTLSLQQFEAFKAAFPHITGRPLQSLESVSVRKLSKNALEEYEAVDKEFFLNREFGRDREETNPGYIIFPIIGTLSLCFIMMIAIFQREDPARRKVGAGGLDAQATTIGRGYGRL